jgi:hypothetical protein
VLRAGRRRRLGGGRPAPAVVDAQPVPAASPRPPVAATRHRRRTPPATAVSGRRPRPSRSPDS